MVSTLLRETCFFWHLGVFWRCLCVGVGGLGAGRGARGSFVLARVGPQWALLTVEKAMVFIAAEGVN